MTEIRRNMVPIGSDVSKAAMEISGGDLYYLVTVLGKMLDEKEFNCLADESCNLAHQLAQDIFDRTDSGNEQMCLMAMVACHLMATIYGNIEYTCGMLEIDELTADTDGDVDGTSFEPLPGNDR